MSWIQVLLLAVSSFVQVASGEITGLVTDPFGAAAPGVTVTVTDAATNRQRVVITGDDGFFAAVNLNPATYRVEVALSGFSTIRQDGIRLTTGQKLRMDFVLVIGRSEDVVVRADVPMVRGETGSLGTTVEQAQVAQLPLNGRTFITLTALVPGVALPPGSQLPRINGGRPRTNEYLFDGISVLQPEPGQVAFFPIVDAIQEFKVESNSPSAEFGRFNGGVINLTTRAGGNAVHGDAFEFFRHEALNARNYFQRAALSKPRYRRSQFGGVLGGPVVRDRTFFFVDYQGQRQSIDRSVTSSVPTLLQRQGVFTEAIGGRVPAIFDPSTTAGGVRQAFANNTIPANRIDPVAAALLQRYPLPTGSGTANNFTRTAAESDTQDQWDVRVDHRFSARDQAFGRVTRFSGRFTPVTPLPDGSGVTTGTLGPQDTVSWSTALNYQRTFSDRVVNELRIGDTRRSVHRAAASLLASARESIGLPGIPSITQFPLTLPTFLISGYQQLGSPPNTASDFATSVSEVADSLTWLKGRHTIKTGFDWRWERLNVIQPPSPSGTFTFNTLGSNQPGVTTSGNALASFLLGQVQNFTIDLQQQVIRERARFQEYFIQDDWKVTRKLTINAGLRYTLNFPSTEINGQTAVFNLGTQLLEYPSTEPVRPLKKNNFGPRLAGVYRLTDRDIVSAGYGRIWIEMAGITTPFTTPSFPFLQTLTQRSLDSLNPAFVLKDGPTVVPIAPTPTAGLGQGVFSVNGDLGSGYAQQWNASYQRQITSDMTMELAYAGSKITNVGIPDSNLNQLTVEQLAIGPSLLQSVPNPYFGIIPRSSSLGDPTITVAQLMKPYPQYTTVSLYRNNVGVTRYDAFEASLRRRLSRGLLFSAAYTRSKLVDTASSVFDASILTGPVANFQIADSHDLSRERDYSTGDIPHVLVASAVWNLGAKWTFTGIVTLQSGVPVAVTQTTNFNAFAGFGTQRPTLVGDPKLPSHERTPEHWFNTAAFATTPQFALGDATRNPVRGPSYRNVDMAVVRRFALWKDSRLELRAEVFNLFNTAQFGAPAAVAGSASFGTIATAFDPRVFQLAAKVVF